MTKNIGQVDRVLRVMLGLALLTIVLVIEGPGRWWGLLGIVPLVTAAMGSCPAYTLLHISTTDKQAPPKA